MKLLDNLKKTLANLQAVPWGESSKVGPSYGEHLYRDTTLTFAQIRAMRKHPVVKFCLQFLKMPMARVQLIAQCEDESIQSFLHEVYEPIANNYLRMGANCLDYGFQAFETVWAYRPIEYNVNGVNTTIMAVCPMLFKQLKPEDTTILVDNKNSFNGIEYNNSDGSVIKLSKEKSILITNRYEDGQLYGISELESAKRPWSRQDNLETFAMRYFETKADPIPVIRFDNRGVYKDSTGAVVNTRDEAYSMGTYARQGRPIALPSVYDEKGNPLWDIKYLEAGDKAPLYRSAMEYFDTAIMRALLVPERSLTQAEATGSYSMAESHGSFLIERQEEVIDIVRAALQEQNLPLVMAYNFGQKKYNVELTTSGMRETDKDLTSQVAGILLQRGDISPEQKEWLEKRTGIPFPEEEAIVVAPVVPPVAMADCDCGKKHLAVGNIGWRPLRAWEDKIKLGQLNNYLDRWIQQTESTLLIVLAKQKDRYTKKLESILRENKVSARLNALKGLELSYQNEYKGTLYEAITTLMEQCARYACEELGIKYQGILPDAVGWARAQADATWYKHDGDLRSALNFAVTDSISKGQTDKAILFAAEEIWKLWLTPNTSETLGKLGQMSVVIASQAVNRGREIARQTYDDSEDAETNPIVAVQRSEVLDKRVCRYCKEILDEKIVDIKDPAYEEFFLVEPHFGCRGVNIFITQSERKEYRTDPEYQFKKPTANQLDKWVKETP